MMEQYGVDMFESSVILQGTKTKSATAVPEGMFESSVILQGTKTNKIQEVKK